MRLIFYQPEEPLRECLRHRRAGISLLCGLMMLLASQVPTFAQSVDDALRFTQRSPAAGGSTMGLAGSGTAGIAGFGAFYSNPAGLGYFETSQISGTIGHLRATSKTQFDPLAPENLQISSQSLNQLEVPQAGFIYKYPSTRRSLVFGAGITQSASFIRAIETSGDNSASSVTDTFLPPSGSFEIVNGEPVFDRDLQRMAFEAGAIEFFQDDYQQGRYPFQQAVAPATTIRQQDVGTAEGQLNEVHVGGAWQIASSLFAGLSLNLSYGSYENSRFFRESDVLGENIPEMYNVLKNGQTLRGFQRLEIEERVSTTLRGFHLRTGLSAEPIPQLRIGVTIESPTVYSLNDTYGTRIQTGFVEGGMLVYGSTNAFERDYQLRTPWRFGSGIKFDVADIRIMADVEYIDWTQLEVRSNDTDVSAVNQQILDDFTSTLNLQGGIEWSFSFATFHGGIARHPDPRTDIIELPGNETTDRSKTFFTLGTNFDVLPQFAIDISWMLEGYTNQHRPYPDLTEIPGEFDPAGEPVSMIAPFVDENIRRNSIRIGFSYRF